MNKIVKMSQLAFRLVCLEKQKKALYAEQKQIQEEMALYAEQKQIQEEMALLAESILYDTREGETLETLAEKESEGNNEHL